jgi:hypothetical protein
LGLLSLLVSVGQRADPFGIDLSLLTRIQLSSCPRPTSKSTLPTLSYPSFRFLITSSFSFFAHLAGSSQPLCEQPFSLWGKDASQPVSSISSLPPPPCHAQLSRFPINTDLISHPTSIADVSLTERCRTLPRPPYSPPPIPPQHLQSHLPTPDRIVPLSPIFLFRFRPDRRRQPNHHGPLRAPQRTHRFGSKGGSPDHLRREASASSREEWRRRSVLRAYADCGQGGNRD